MKHTPGPWNLDPNGWCYEADVFENQKLCQAAPELLEALKLLVKEVNLPKLNVKKDFSLMVAHAAALKALNKATGE